MYNISPFQKLKKRDNKNNVWARAVKLYWIDSCDKIVKWTKVVSFEEDSK